MTATQAPTPGPLSASDVKLLPCPFCGNRPDTQSFWYGAAPGNEPRGYHVFCLECSDTDALDGPRRDTLEAAIEAWNTRPYLAPTAPVEASGSGECSDLYRLDDPFNGSVTRLVSWPEGLVLWHDGEIVWRSWGPKALRPQPSGSERDGYVTAFYDIAKMLGIGARAWSPAETWLREMRPKLEAALRPQPSGETRADFTPVVGLWKDQSLSRFDRVKAHNFEFGSDVRTAVKAVDEEASRQALLSARPLALGSQQGEDWRCPDCGAQADERFDCCKNPARAEAQDEGAAGEPVAWDSDVLDTFGGYSQNVLTRTPYVAKTGERVRSQTPLYAHSSPTPTADADRVRIAVEALEGAQQIAARLDGHDAEMMADEIEAINEALAVLKSEGK